MRVRVSPLELVRFGMSSPVLWLVVLRRRPDLSPVALAEAKTIRHNVQWRVVPQIGRDVPVEYDHLGRPCDRWGLGSHRSDLPLMLPNAPGRGHCAMSAGVERPFRTQPICRHPCERKALFWEY